MNRKAALVAISLLVPSSASADLTVIYAPPGPPAPLVAEVVSAPEGRAPAERSSRVDARSSVERAESPPVSAPVAAPTAPLAARPGPAASPIAPPATAPTTAPIAPAATAPAAAPIAPGDGAPLRVLRVGEEGREEATLALLDAEGRPDPASLVALSLLARPRDTDRPSEADLRAHEDDLEWVATDLRRLHPALLFRLAQIRARFPDHAIEIVSGFRPDARETSRHRIGRALDLRVVGVSIDALDAFLRTLPETGVGLYPTSEFVHVDVRAESLHWVDLRGADDAPPDR